MICEMSVVFTVCCVAPPGVQNEIRYQLTNPPNIICFPPYILSSQSEYFLSEALNYVLLPQLHLTLISHVRVFPPPPIFCFLLKTKESFYHVTC